MKTPNKQVGVKSPIRLQHLTAIALLSNLFVIYTYDQLEYGLI